MKEIQLENLDGVFSFNCNGAPEHISKKEEQRIAQEATVIVAANSRERIVSIGCEFMRTFYLYSTKGTTRCMNGRVGVTQESVEIPICPYAHPRQTREL
jgi:hypothetical protein